MSHRREVAESVRIGQVPVLAKGFAIKASLHIVKPTSVSSVVTGIDSSLRIDLNPKGIAATLRENFESMGLGLISPSKLAHAMNRFESGNGLVVRSMQNDVSCYGAPVGGVNPTIRPPAQIVGDGVGILQTKT